MSRHVLCSAAMKGAPLSRSLSHPLLSSLSLLPRPSFRVLPSPGGGFVTQGDGNNLIFRSVFRTRRLYTAVYDLIVGRLIAFSSISRYFFSLFPADEAKIAGELRRYARIDEVIRADVSQGINLQDARYTTHQHQTSTSEIAR